METIVAVLKAVKAFFLMSLMIAVAVFLFPSLGLFNPLSEMMGGDIEVIQLGLGLALLAILFQSARSVTLQRHQSILARQLIKLSPDLRRLDAVKILVQALGSEKESVRENAGKELRRLTGQDFGNDTRAWNQWVRRQEKARDNPEGESSGTNQEGD